MSGQMRRVPIIVWVTIALLAVATIFTSRVDTIQAGQSRLDYEVLVTYRFDKNGVPDEIQRPEDFVIELRCRYDQESRKFVGTTDEVDAEELTKKKKHVEERTNTNTMCVDSAMSCNHHDSFCRKKITKAVTVMWAIEYSPSKLCKDVYLKYPKRYTLLNREGLVPRFEQDPIVVKPQVKRKPPKVVVTDPPVVNGGLEVFPQDIWFELVDEFGDELKGMDALSCDMLRDNGSMETRSNLVCEYDQKKSMWHAVMCPVDTNYPNVLELTPLKSPKAEKEPVRGDPCKMKLVKGTKRPNGKVTFRVIKRSCLFNPVDPGYRKPTFIYNKEMLNPDSSKLYENTEARDFQDKKPVFSVAGVRMLTLPTELKTAEAERNVLPGLKQTILHLMPVDKGYAKSLVEAGQFEYGWSKRVKEGAVSSVQVQEQRFLDGDDNMIGYTDFVGDTSSEQDPKSTAYFFG